MMYCKCAYLNQDSLHEIYSLLCILTVLLFWCHECMDLTIRLIASMQDHSVNVGNNAIDIGKTLSMECPMGFYMVK